MGDKWERDCLLDSKIEAENQAVEYLQGISKMKLVLNGTGFSLGCAVELDVLFTNLT